MQLNELKENIELCENCYDFSELNNQFIRVFKINEILDAYQITESEFEISCPECGGNLLTDSRVAVKIIPINIQEQNKRIWKKDHEKNFENFLLYLEDFPFLGMKHLIGKEISRIIGEFPKVDIVNDNYYRGRVFEEGKIPTSDDMGPPPYGKCAEIHRFNYPNMIHFYLADSEATMRLELEKTSRFEGKRGKNFFQRILNLICNWKLKKAIWIQKVNINEISNILDLRKYYKPWENIKNAFIAGIIEEQYFMRTSGNKQLELINYIFSNFLSDLAKKNDFNGICYHSCKNKEGENLVIFGPQDFEFIGKPYKIT
jgi:hypothetical protein